VNFWRYSVLVFGFSAATLLVLFLTNVVATRDRSAFLFGNGIATINAILAYALVVLSSRRSAKALMICVLGGMLGRMTLMLAAVFLAATWLALAAVPLVLSLLGYFILFLAFELAVLHKRASERAIQS
jgi:hypothetical protein